LPADTEAPTVSDLIRVRGGYELLVCWDNFPGGRSLEALASRIQQVFAKKQIRTNMTTYPNPAQKWEDKLVIIKVQIVDPRESRKHKRHRKEVRAAREDIKTLLPGITLAVNTNAQPITERRKAPVRIQHSFKPVVATASIRMN